MLHGHRRDVAARGIGTDGRVAVAPVAELGADDVDVEVDVLLGERSKKRAVVISGGWGS